MMLPIDRRALLLGPVSLACVLAACSGTPQRAEEASRPEPGAGGGQMVLVEQGDRQPAPAAAATKPAAPSAGWSSPTATGGGKPATAPAAAPAIGTSKWKAVVNGEETPALAIPMGDDATLARIIDEGVNRNQVMQHLRNLTNIGPRLTGSTNIEKADAWLRQQYERWGLKNVQREQWGTIGMRFDRGPSKGVLLASEQPGGTMGVAREFEFTTMAWTKGTNGPVRAKVVKLPAEDADYDKVKDQIKGAWVLIPAAPASGQRGVRRGLTEYFRQAVDVRKAMADVADKKEPMEEPKGMIGKAVRDGAAGFIASSGDERVWTGAVGGWRTASVATTIPDVFISVRKSDYEAIDEKITSNANFAVEFDLKHTLTDGPIPVYNVIAEIPGTEKPEEVVIISAHMDSWNGPGSQGATDNGTGTVVTLEAARILIASGARPKRTIRFIHWSGEEQGLLGSRGYVEKHKDEMGRISACFVDDGGTNSEGGIPCIESMKDMLAAATAPANGLFTDTATNKPLTCNVRVVGRMPRGGSSDHASFNAVGVPGFFWDEVGRADYGYGWHTQNDKYELGVPEYLMQSSTNSAIVAYRLACAPTLLPREVRADEDERPARPAPPAEPGKAPAQPTRPVGAATGSGTPAN